jgi:hypothetical protein
MKKVIFSAIAILAFACTKTGTVSLNDSSVQTDVINPRHPIGIYKQCYNTSLVDTPFYRVVLRYETADIIPSGRLTYTTSKGVLVTSVVLPPYTRKAVIALLIGKNSPVGYIQITNKGVVATTVKVDGTNICN